MIVRLSQVSDFPRFEIGYCVSTVLPIDMDKVLNATFLFKFSALSLKLLTSLMFLRLILHSLIRSSNFKNLNPDPALIEMDNYLSPQLKTN